MAGGTGGHIFPGLAVAHELQNQGWQIEWLGTTHGLEAKLVPEQGIPLHCISVAGLRGKRLGSRLVTSIKLLGALIQSLKVIRRLKPTIVIGMGGFVAGPGGLAAWLLRVPLVIHEQNAIAGTTNRCLSFLATKVLEGFPHSFTSRAKACWTGNPVRAPLLQLPSPEERFAHRQGPVKLLIIGGSRGARVLNSQAPLALKTLKLATGLEIWHQTGEAGFADYALAYQQVGIEARVEAFIQDMAAAYAWADLVLCRAGALTIAELSIVGVASLLVPFPFAINNHQWHNAAFLRNAGAAVILAESDLNAASLASQLSILLSDRAHLRTMANAAYLLAKREALTAVVQNCVEVAHRVIHC
jgi:UDP-N-acetylglucosamine--N-acetylmuramyl-(pentapeptide) pyrophosphoryl-undecaprenol N-acetylglucosamine transferase